MITLTQRLFQIILVAAILGLLPVHARETVDFTVTCPRLPFPVRLHYSDNLTIPNHISPYEQGLLISSVYDRWKANYLSFDTDQQTGQKNYRVMAGKTKTALTYSEGQGYGMMLTVYMAGYDPDAQTIFDGLYRYSRLHHSRIEERFMAYQVPAEESRQNSAFDGDADITFALLLADKQWGSSGTINYRDQALTLIQALSEKVIGRDSNLPMLGDWVMQEGGKYNQYTIRSSDIMPAHFKVFKEASDNEVWDEITHRSQNLFNLIQTKFSPASGLVPDFIVKYRQSTPKPAPAKFLESAFDGAFYYNAARVPWRLAEDAFLFEDSTSMAQLQKMAKWVTDISNGDPTKIGPGFNLDGTRINNDYYLSMAFIAPFGLAAMTLKDQQGFVNQAFDLCVTVHQDYYEDSISLFCLLLMSGNYWLPILGEDALGTGLTSGMNLKLAEN